MLPPNAKKVFEGKIFQVYQWPQKMFDGSTATFEAVRRNDAANVICVTGRGTILFQLQTQPHRLIPFGCLPCGGIDEGEEPLAGAKRELLEETGYVSDDWEFFHSVEPSEKVLWTIYSFICRGAKKVAEPKLEPGERITVEEISFEELLDRADSDEFLHLDVKPELIRAKYDPASREALRIRLFGI